ncbi:hypothetical protein EOD42_23200 [Rhodovarius crocodyli]|uniref:DUF2190 family protein n=1 Tax=Rhodovarius crocodyli TaxID=1979269 RepID=A0A437LZ63_9PROT|nr:hypothetical protein [Rhodovarius crocodyli]RVT90711.1 hypothetical protein EOD42_23200 [Rhodovarius crocodyli]
MTKPLSLSGRAKTYTVGATAQVSDLPNTPGTNGTILIALNLGDTIVYRQYGDSALVSGDVTATGEDRSGAILPGSGEIITVPGTWTKVALVSPDGTGLIQFQRAEGGL